MWVHINTKALTLNKTLGINHIWVYMNRRDRSFLSEHAVYLPSITETFDDENKTHQYQLAYEESLVKKWGSSNPTYRFETKFQYFLSDGALGNRYGIHIILKPAETI